MMYTRQTHRYPARREWEYKIVRARRREFAHPHHRRILVEQEAQAGWVLVEVYNNSQAHFRRHRSARRDDAALPPHIDPYRTVYKPIVSPENALLHLIMLAVGVTLAVIVIATVGILLSLPGCLPVISGFILIIR